jgi:hypothetical protein
MKIIFDRSAADSLADKYLILELDTITIGDQLRTIYCLMDDIPIAQIHTLTEFRLQHEKFIDLYKKQQYQDCLIELKKLIDYQFQDINSYYDVMMARIENIVDSTTQDK